MMITMKNPRNANMDGGGGGGWGVNDVLLTVRLTTMM